VGTVQRAAERHVPRDDPGRRIAAHGITRAADHLTHSVIPVRSKTRVSIRGIVLQTGAIV